MNTYKNKNLLLIGAGLLQVPAIKTANELGITTIVTDYNKDAPGMQIAAHPIVISTRDIDGTVRKIKKLNEKIKIDGVITVGTDASMTVAAVANALQLPGIEFINAEAASNKYKMRERFLKHKVPIPAFFKCWSYKELKDAAAKLGYPFVIKPVDNMGARGVMKVENEALLELSFNNAKNASPSGELIVEEYMAGPELSIDALVFDGTIHITGVADRIIEREPYFIETGHVMPSGLDQSLIDDAVEVFKKGINALGITIGAAKGDIKLTSEGAKVGEIAARLSGGFMSACTYPYSSGVNLIHNAIDIALGYPPHNLVPTKSSISIERAIIPTPGIVKEIKGIDEALSIQGVKDIFLHVALGDEVKELKSNVGKAVNFIIEKKTREEALETVNKVLQTIEIITEPDKVITWDEICRNARKKFNRSCFVCKECNGIECRGEIPGMGGVGSGESFVRNINDLKKILIKTRTIHNIKTVDTRVDFLGTMLDIPVVAAPITGCDINLGGQISELEYDIALVQGCKSADTLAFVGDGGQPELYKTGLEALKRARGTGGIIYKPRADQGDIIKRINAADELKVKFVGIDVDAACFTTMELLSQGVCPKSTDDLKELIATTKTPFIIKGIMCSDDAEAAYQAGAKAIVVSNHGGRITDSHPSSISILEQIAAEYGDKLTIIVDGGIRNGEDVFKALALGAHLVMIGRPFSTAVLGGGAPGVSLYIKKIKHELQKIMLLTGADNIASIKKNMIIVPKFYYHECQ